MATEPDQPPSTPSPAPPPAATPVPADPVGYASPGAWRADRPPRSPAVSVGLFLAGMAGPAVTCVGGFQTARAVGSMRDQQGLAFMAACLLLPPGVLMVWPQTRIVAGGWVTTLALVVLIVWFLCAGHR